MANTSGTYNFSSSATVENVINEAYERIGIPPNLTSGGYNIQAAQRSLNFLLASWTNNENGLKLWTVRDYLLALKPGQASYAMPPFTITPLEVNLRESNRNLGGTPFAKVAGVDNGNAANAFDNNPNTACTQTLPDGNIGYSWSTASYAIEMVGVQSNTTTTYTLVFEYTTDGTTWTQVGAPSAQTYTAGTNLWFAIESPQLGTGFRIRETGGATLSIQELYFNSQTQDYVMSAISRSEYISYTRKNQSGRPSSYFTDRQISPVINIWPVPTTLYTTIFFSATTFIQDVGALSNLPEIPSRYYEPLASGLTFLLGLKNPDKVDINRAQFLLSLYQAAFKIACEEDRERVPTRIYGSSSSGWGQA